MKQLISIFILGYYLLGNMCLPCGDYSALCELPDMYRQCKATEDKDMTPFDFITDHLINIDSLFDSHDNGDEQKPHKPFEFHHPLQATFFVLQHFTTPVSQPQIVKPEQPIFLGVYHPWDFTSDVFRPPIV